jgi:hypothetical protein
MNKPRGIRRLLLFAGFGAVAVAAWLGYQRSEFIIWLGNATWLCT